MRTFLIATFLLVGSALMAQTDTTTFRQPGNYAKAAAYYTQRLRENPQSAHFAHQAACYLALQNKSDSMAYMIFVALTNGDNPQAVVADTDFEPVHNTPQWATVMDTLKAQFLRRASGITHPELAWELWLMGVDDQRTRTLRTTYKKGGTAPDNACEQRTARVDTIVKQYGWPKISMVGPEAAEAVFLVVQHSNRIKNYLPFLVKAAAEGEASKAHAAMMVDRYLCSRTFGPFKLKPVQIFGTQFSSNGKMDKSTGAITWESKFYLPIADFANLDARRAYIGKSDFETECKRFGAKYSPPSKQDRSIRIMRRWVKRGYLLGFEKAK